VLGCDWIKNNNPISLYLRENPRQLTVFKDGQFRIVFQDFTAPSPKPLITIAQLQKLCRAETCGYVIMIIELEQHNEVVSYLQAQHEIETLLQEFAGIFASSKSLPPKREHDHQIPLQPNSKPPNVRHYRVPHKQKDEVDKLIPAMLKEELIRPSHSPYASPTILVRKKDESWRMCVDYRELNSQTIKNKFPIPVIEDLLDELHGTRIFNKLDLKSGYHQIRMKKEDIHKTPFRTYLGHFEFLVMPFGLTNAPATFQALLNTIFAAYLRKFVLVFFDDILIYNKSEQEHVDHLKLVLQTLRQHELTTNISKCLFATEKVEYLGHIITGQGVATNPSNIEAIQKWNTPKSLT
jgi:hypothetical protein